MPITYQQESLVTVKNELENLLQLEWEEVQHDVGADKPDPDWDTYFLLEDLGKLMIFTARSGGKIVGYFSATINPDLHCKGKMLVCNDAIFVHPDYRKSGVGIRLFKFAEKCLSEDGFDRLYVNTTERNNIDGLMSHMGYIKTESRHFKWIGKKHAN
jgi:GNAT superfamily N-acetyltransferase